MTSPLSSSMWTINSGRVCLLLVAAAWIGNALYAAGVPDGWLKMYSPALVAAAMIYFLIYHGRRAEGGPSIFRFVIAVFLIGWIFETVSIRIGIPFGHYHYTDLMWPFLGHVPVSVMPAYCVMGYVSWATARCIVGLGHRSARLLSAIALPVLAAALMVIWDLSMDPLRATVEGRWVWHNGGPHFGIPLLNFVGWFVVTLMMFSAYALFRSTGSAPERPPDEETNLAFRLSAPLMYLAFPVEYCLNPFWSQDVSVVAVNDALVPVADIQADVAALTATTMLPIAILAIAVTTWRYGLPFRKANAFRSRHPGLRDGNTIQAPDA